MPLTPTPHIAVLDAPVPPDVSDEFLAKLHYVSEALERFAFVDDKRDRVRFELRPGGSPEEIATRMRSVAAKMSAQWRAFESRVLVDRLDRPTSFAGDPHGALAEAGELVRFGPGRYALGPRIVHLMRAVEAFVHWTGREFGAPRTQFPALIGGDVLDRCAYLRSFPHSLSLVSHLREDLAAIQGFATTTHWEGDRLVYERDHLAASSCLLPPSICFHWYAALAGRRFDQGIASEATGKCFRWESGNIAGLERLYDFTMQEIMFMGHREAVLAKRQRSIEVFSAALDELGLAYEIRSATDPFFVDEYAQQVTFQKAFELKFEVRALLPYKKQTFAVASFNYHQDFFGRAFDIRSTDGTPLHSSCTGFGLERAALMVLAQFGLDPAGWPAPLAEGFGS
jgi:seryl-tRNA synthetase